MNLSRLPDSELLRLCAEEVMGWRKIKANSPSGAIGGFQRQVEGQNSFKMEFDWNPLKDWNDTMDVVGELKSKKLSLKFEFMGGQTGVLVGRTDRIPLGVEVFVHYVDKDPQKAILVAALLAVRSQS